MSAYVGYLQQSEKRFSDLVLLRLDIGCSRVSQKNVLFSVSLLFRCRAFLNTEGQRSSFGLVPVCFQSNVEEVAEIGSAVFA